MSNKSVFESQLEMLDIWRNFAAYKLEQRIDPLIGMYLPSILEHRFRGKVHKDIIPEFPFPINMILKGEKYSSKNRRCDRIDYAAFDELGRTLYLVELKTEKDSFSGEQLEKLQQVAGRNIANKWISSLFDVASSSSKPRKYIPIFGVLRRWGLINEIEEIVVAATERKGRGLKKILADKKPLGDTDEWRELRDSVELKPLLIAPEKCIEKVSRKEYEKICFMSLEYLAGVDDIPDPLKAKLVSWSANEAACSDFLARYHE